MPTKFRTKPVEIEAIKFTGDNIDEIKTWTGGRFYGVVLEDRGDDPEIIAEVLDELHSTWVGVKLGQWILRGVKGEFYPCDEEAFFWKYEFIDGQQG